MNVYSFDPITGEYRGITRADPDPRRPGKFLLPAFTTPVAPPEGVEKGHKAVWQGGVWTELPVEFIEPLPEPLTLDKAKAKMRDQINLERDTQLNGGFYFWRASDDPSGPPHNVDSYPQAQSNIMLAAQLAQLPGAPATIMWRMANDQMVELTVADVIAMANAMGQHIRDTYRRSWERKVAVEKAQTVEEVLAL